jgi:hypothetical protein
VITVLGVAALILLGASWLYQRLADKPQRVESISALPLLAIPTAWRKRNR